MVWHNEFVLFLVKDKQRLFCSASSKVKYSLFVLFFPIFLQAGVLFYLIEQQNRVYSIPCYSTIVCSIPCYSTIVYSIPCYSIIIYSIPCCSTIVHSITCCSIQSLFYPLLQHNSSFYHLLQNRVYSIPCCSRIEFILSLVVAE